MPAESESLGLETSPTSPRYVRLDATGERNIALSNDPVWRVEQGAALPVNNFGLRGDEQILNPNDYQSAFTFATEQTQPDPTLLPITAGTGAASWHPQYGHEIYVNEGSAVNIPAFNAYWQDGDGVTLRSKMGACIVVLNRISLLVNTPVEDVKLTIMNRHKDVDEAKQSLQMLVYAARGPWNVGGSRLCWFREERVEDER
ncbi:hypothetical protein MKZ38_000357 [Zalerion maritima]|uniref:Uncharacterized protein n=1 Tax=Zalerion maritima TaxID=339359 RepID=A0AAD5WTS6_9PEZI|nr:hypothetical protein MKZ38_000357 [Zalerion maritima]